MRGGGSMSMRGGGGMRGGGMSSGGSMRGGMRGGGSMRAGGSMQGGMRGGMSSGMRGGMHGSMKGGASGGMSVAGMGGKVVQGGKVGAMGMGAKMVRVGGKLVQLQNAQAAPRPHIKLSVSLLGWDWRSYIMGFKYECKSNLILFSVFYIQRFQCFTCSVFQYFTCSVFSVLRAVFSTFFICSHEFFKYWNLSLCHKQMKEFSRVLWNFETWHKQC